MVTSMKTDVVRLKFKLDFLLELIALGHSPRQVSNLLGKVQILHFLVQFWKSLAQMASAVNPSLLEHKGVTIHRTIDIHHDS